MNGYKWVIGHQAVIRLSDGAHIPNDRNNLDWQMFERWIIDGNKPDEADAIIQPIDLTPEKLKLKDSTAKADDRLDALVKILGF